MRNLYYFPLLLITVLSLVSCKSEQQKAFEEAIESRDIFLLREFQLTYGNNLEDKIKEQFSSTLDQWIKDSTAFDSYHNETSTLAKYQAGIYYTTNFPDGNYIEFVKDELIELKSKYNSIQEDLDDLREGFKNYIFIEDNSDLQSYLDEYEFTGPDEYGKGEVIIKAIPINIYVSDVYFQGIVNRECKGYYSMNDDEQLIVNIEETRTYDGYAKAWSMAGTEQEIKETVLKLLERDYPAPKNRKLILNTNLFFRRNPQLYGKDSNRASVDFKTVMKDSQ